MVSRCIDLCGGGLHNEHEMMSQRRRKAVSEHERKKCFELAKQLLELSDKVIGILPLGDPNKSFDWEKVKMKILTKDDTAELMRLAREIQKVREELDKM
jgi:hypothetical protein